MNECVKGSAMTDVVKVWVCALGSLLLAAWLAPIAYNGGKVLFELSATKDFNGLIDRFAVWSGPAKLLDFFKWCWVLSSLLLLLPLVEWLDFRSHQKNGKPWKIRLPHGARNHQALGQALRPNKRGPMQALIGFLLTLGCFLAIGWVLVKAGAFVWEGKSRNWAESLWKDLAWIMMGTIMIEVFFRSVVLGIFLRAMNVLPAIMLAAVMFGLPAFVVSGFVNTVNVDKEAITTFQLMGLLLLKGGGERFLIYFLPWFAFGCVLGWARWRTASLWLPGGLLAGWLLADNLFSRAANPVRIPDPIAVLFSSDSVHNGIIPFLGVIGIGWLIHILTHQMIFSNETAD